MSLAARCLGAGVFVFALASVPVMARASLLPVAVKPGQISMPLHTGAVTGGLAGRDLSILSVKESSLPNGHLQLVIAFGDHGGHPVNGEPAYFHASIDRGARRISIDFAQVTRTAVDQKDLSRALGRSRIVALSEMTMDPQDNSTNISLSLRQPVNFQVRTETSDQAKLILDLQPMGSVSPDHGASVAAGR